MPAPDADVAVLLSMLEPAALETRLETALALLGRHRSAIAEAVAGGLVRVVDERVEVTDADRARVIVNRAGDRERSAAHLALACAQIGGVPRHEARSLFERLSQALDGHPRPVSLTRQEQHVAELAATGAPTREIAAAAYLSPKTVEYHLTRIYRKLGVRSKAELAWAFHGG